MRSFCASAHTNAPTLFHIPKCMHTRSHGDYRQDAKMAAAKKDRSRVVMNLSKEDLVRCFLVSVYL